MQKREKNVESIVAPPYLYIAQVVDTLKEEFSVAAHNSWVGAGGAFTGEISADQMVDIGVTWVTQGHSERRILLGETNNTFGKKAKYALSKGIGVMACTGEKLEEREANKTTEVCFKQLQAYLDEVKTLVQDGGRI